jgi:hypothetical protein
MKRISLGLNYLGHFMNKGTDIQWKRRTKRLKNTDKIRNFTLHLRLPDIHLSKERTQKTIKSYN